MLRTPSARRAGILLAAWILAFPGPATVADSAAPQNVDTPPSVVLIVLDTARADHFHCYGYPLPTTPATDRLASEGAMFLEAISQAVNTNPSHASLFTGLLPNAHGNHNNSTPLDPAFETLATILAKAGYRTGAFVSGYTMVAKISGFKPGFEVYNDQFSGRERRAEETVDRALAWLRSLPQEKPYFLFVHLFDPHGIYDPPPGFAEKFRTGKYEAFPESAEIPSYQQLQIGGALSRDPLEYISRYDGEIHYADAQVGRLLKAVAERPIVIFAADHGETLAERTDYLFGHGARLYEEAVRVPLVFRFPEKELRGKRIGGVARLVDVLPTLLSYLDLPAPSPLAGRSLLPFIRAGGIPPGNIAISEGRASPRDLLGGQKASFRMRPFILSARDDRYKLIRYSHLTGAEATLELFDLKKDPAERNNIASTDLKRASSLLTALEDYQTTMTPPPQPPDPDEEAKKKLRSLGYVD